MENLDEIKKLIEKYLNHNASASERDRIIQIIRMDSDIEHWFQNQIENTSRVIDHNIKQNIYDNVCNETNMDCTTQPLYKRHQFKRIYAISIAASILLIVAILGVTFYTQSSYVARPFVISTTTGNRSLVTLPDGTDVYLNSMTRISYYYDKKSGTRIAKLCGEAFFDVAQDESHPFNVEVGELKVECKGTKFNIHAYPDEESIAVVLDEGHVVVCTDDESVDMKPNMMTRYNRKNGRLIKSNVESHNFCEWINGYVYFDNERFVDIIKVISRNYGITVNILSPQLKEERFTGSIYQIDINKILNVLSAASGARYEIVNDSVINLSY